MIAYTDWHEALKEKVVPDRCCQEHYQNCGRNYTNMFWNRVSQQLSNFLKGLLFWGCCFLGFFCPRSTVENVLNKQISEHVMSNRKRIQKKENQE